jgi:hypothetical protein
MTEFDDGCRLVGRAQLIKGYFVRRVPLKNLKSSYAGG